MRKRVVVIGGGIAGLSAAHRLVELGRDEDLDLEVILLESTDRVGGVISTIEKDGFLIEEGPDAFITTKPWALELCGRLGLTGVFIETEKDNRRAFVLLNNELIPIPEGFQMLAPGSLLTFLKTPLFTWRGKARMLMDLVLPRKQVKDESLASFVRRRLGTEALERAAQPMISGVYTSDPETLSLSATMPQFIRMEEKYGSVIKGIYRSQRVNSKQGKDSGARYSLFLSFKRGMGTLVDALLEKLPPGSLKLNRKVERIERTGEGWNVVLKDGVEKADGVVIAAPSYTAGKFLESADPSLAQDLRTIEYASSAVVISVHKKKDIAHNLDGFGFVVPSIENSRLIACSFSSVKFKGRAPEDSVILRSFVGGALDPSILDLKDREIVQIIQKEISTVLGINSDPLFTILKRYPDAMPQYNLGHLDLVGRIKEKVNKLKGLEVAGSAYEGVGIPDCVHSGEKAAHAIIETLFNNKRK